MIIKITSTQVTSKQLMFRHPPKYGFFLDGIPSPDKHRPMFATDPFWKGSGLIVKASRARYGEMCRFI